MANGNGRLNPWEKGAKTRTETSCGHVPHWAKGLCRDCYVRDYQRNNKRVYKERHKAKIERDRRVYYLQRNYGLTEETYLKMLAKYHNACWICGLVPGEGRRRLSVDHDHKTGRVRGLLCYPCNKGISLFKDSPELLRKAIDYLEGKL